MQEKHLREAKEQMAGTENRFGFVVASEGWHPGIVGLVASKLMEEHYRPTIAVSLQNGMAKGSARSIKGIHITETLQSCADLLQQFGGHAAAAGLTLPIKNLEAFTRRFEAAVQKQATESTFEKSLDIDTLLPFHQIDEVLLNDLQRLRPFGIGNPTPIFTAEDLNFSGPSIVGKSHLKMRVSFGKHQFEAIGFQMGNRLGEIGEKGRIAFTPDWNEYQGVRNIQLKIKDIVFS